MSESPVLLIDDDENVRATVRDMLDLEGIPALAVSPEVDLEKAIGEDGVRVIVTDLNMPGRDGLQILQTVKGIAARLQVEVSVFVATGAGGEGRIKDAEAQGAAGCFFKPFDIDEFVDRIRSEREKTAA